jgi:hypothetical protein
LLCQGGCIIKEPPLLFSYLLEGPLLVLSSFVQVRVDPWPKISPQRIVEVGFAAVSKEVINPLVLAYIVGVRTITKG